MSTIFLAPFSNGFDPVPSPGPNPTAKTVKKMSTRLLNTVSDMDLGPQTPIAPNPSVNKAQKMSTHFLSLG